MSTVIITWLRLLKSASADIPYFPISTNPKRNTSGDGICMDTIPSLQVFPIRQNLYNPNIVSLSVQHFHFLMQFSRLCILFLMVDSPGLSVTPETAEIISVDLRLKGDCARPVIKRKSG